MTNIPQLIKLISKKGNSVEKFINVAQMIEEFEQSVQTKFI